MKSSLWTRIFACKYWQHCSIETVLYKSVGWNITEVFCVVAENVGGGAWDLRGEITCLHVLKLF
jgi:hypothetical protein